MPGGGLNAMVIHPLVELLDADHDLAAGVHAEQLTSVALSLRNAVSQKHLAKAPHERAQLVRIVCQAGSFVAALIEVTLQPFEIAESGSQ
jgi:hypothetical protein